MKIAALIFGILAGLSGLPLATMAHALVGAGGGTNGALLYLIPIASLLGGGLALTLPILSALLMAGSALALFALGANVGYGVNIITISPLALNAIGAILAIGGIEQSGGQVEVSRASTDFQRQQDATAFEAPPPPKSYDQAKWEALVRYDPEIAVIAKKLEPLGSKWVDQFAADFLILGDRRYLLEMVKKIISDARAEAIEKEEQAAIERQEIERRASERRAADEVHSQKIKARGQALWGSPLRLCVTVLVSVAVIVGGVIGGRWAALMWAKSPGERISSYQYSAVQGNYPFNLATANPAALAALRRVIPGTLQSIDWIYNLNGVGNEITKLDRDGQEYLLGSVCKPHDCGDNKIAFLVSASGSRAVLGIRSTEFGWGWYGNPTMSDVNLINAKF